MISGRAAEKVTQVGNATFSYGVTDKEQRTVTKLPAPVPARSTRPAGPPRLNSDMFKAGKHRRTDTVSQAKRTVFRIGVSNIAAKYEYYFKSPYSVQKY